MAQDTSFKVIDGTVITTYAELVHAVSSMSDSVFTYHLNDQKNDFYPWIRDVLKHHEAAEALKHITNKAHFLIVLKKFHAFKVLVLNAGSSSLKFQLIDSETETALMKGVFDRIGKTGSSLSVSAHGQTVTKNLAVQNHEQAVTLALKSLVSFQIINSYTDIGLIGHRVVHGGERFVQPTLITDEVIQEIRTMSMLAPEHNPANLAGILACKHVLPHTKQIAVFDTAFHRTIPRMAFLYGIPYELYETYGIRKYGFHGISNQYVSRKAAEVLDKDDHEMIVCHLGNGSSITAVKNGESVDTSMGFTPLDGLIMGTRSGDLDPEIVLFLLRKHYSLEQLETLLNKQSGLKGVTGLSDMREIWAAAQKNNQRAQLAIDMLAYRISLFVGGYMTILHGLDALVFTGGIGENAWYLREKVCAALAYMGLKIDPVKNKNNEQSIHTPDSSMSVLVIPTNEEQEIARECVSLEQS